MKLVFLFGDAAVGKMTVGWNSQKYRFKLFLNHMRLNRYLKFLGVLIGTVIREFRESCLEFANRTNTA